MPEQLERRTDDQGRVALGANFADTLVVVEQIGEDEVRIRRAPRRAPKKYTLEELLADVTPDQFHGETPTGHAVGNEVSEA